MVRLFAVTLSLLVALSFAVVLSAKGPTTKITISGPSLPKPIDITDEGVVRQFQVWAGPGVTMSRAGTTVEETEGFIIDWSSGVVGEHPRGLPHFDVAFYVGSSNEPVYVVSYEFDRDTEEGYVYLPGPADRLYSLNSSAMLHGHGFEGHWLRASSAWQNVIGSMQQQAVR